MATDALACAATLAPSIDHRRAVPMEAASSVVASLFFTRQR
jgi:hypothetical protein